MPRGPALPFGLPAIDERLADQGLNGAGLHEIAAASASLNDDAAATLFTAGIAARFAAEEGLTVLWAVTCFDLYVSHAIDHGAAPLRNPEIPHCTRKLLAIAHIATI